MQWVLLLHSHLRLPASGKMPSFSHDSADESSSYHAANRSRSRSGTGDGHESPRRVQREVLAGAVRSKAAKNGFDSAVMERLVDPMLLLQQELAGSEPRFRADALATRVSATLSRRWAKKSLFQRFCQGKRGGAVGGGGGEASAAADSMSLGEFLELLEAGLGLLAPGMKMSREGAEDIFLSEASNVGMEEEKAEGVEEGGRTRIRVRATGSGDVKVEGTVREKVVGFAGFVRCMDKVARWHGLPSLRGGGTSQKAAGPEAFVRWCTDVEGAISDEDGLVLVDSFFDVLEGVGVIPGAISRQDAEEAFGGRSGGIKPLEFRVYTRRIASMLFSHHKHGGGVGGGGREAILALVEGPRAPPTTSVPATVGGGESEGFETYCDCSRLEVGLGKWAQYHLPASSTLRHIWMPVPHRIFARYADLPFACGEDAELFDEVDEAGDYKAGLRLLVKYRGHIRAKYGFESHGHMAAATQEVIYSILRTQRCSARDSTLAWGLISHALMLTQPTEATPLYDKAVLRTWASGIMAKHLEVIGRHGAALPWCRAAIKTEKDEMCLAWWAMLLSIILSSLRRHEGSLKASQRALQIILQHGVQLDEPDQDVDQQRVLLEGTIATIVALHNCESALHDWQACTRPSISHSGKSTQIHARKCAESQISRACSINIFIERGYCYDVKGAVQRLDASLMRPFTSIPAPPQCRLKSYTTSTAQRRSRRAPRPFGSLFVTYLPSTASPSG